MSRAQSTRNDEQCNEEELSDVVEMTDGIRKGSVEETLEGRVVFFCLIFEAGCRDFSTGIYIRSIAALLQRNVFLEIFNLINESERLFLKNFIVIFVFLR